MLFENPDAIVVEFVTGTVPKGRGSPFPVSRSILEVFVRVYGGYDKFLRPFFITSYYGSTDS
jgi:hypothetical protein